MIPDYYFFDTFHGKRLHLGVTGSVAAYKALDLLRAFCRLEIQVGITLTHAATQFIAPLSCTSLGADPVHTTFFTSSSHFAHLEPASADAFLVAPATANILAKMAHGIADEILSCQLLGYAGPVLAAPAMNPRMWSASVTQENWQTLLRRGVWGIGPDCGQVACGDTGQGKMSGLDQIFIATLRALAPQDLAGLKIMLTVGPTQEYFDCARFWSNPSTGTMGAALAVAAALRGAEVTVVHGPVNITWPSFITTVPVVSAREMFAAAQDIFPTQDIGCFTAAVADFSPPVCFQGKFKKDGSPLTLTFEPNPDILASLSSAKKDYQRTIGFAAEVEDLHAHAQRKLKQKNLDLIVANAIGSPDSGFASMTNRVLLLDRFGREEQWPLLKKTEIAWRIWDWMGMNTP